jgi:hypothetical protein
MYSRVAPCLSRLSRVAVRVGAAWTLNPQYSQRLSFRRLRITAPELGAKGHNTDGFDPWACQHAEFIDSYYSAGDDCGAFDRPCVAHALTALATARQRQRQVHVSSIALRIDKQPLISTSRTRPVFAVSSHRAHGRSPVAV